MPSVQGIVETALYVRNIARAAEFYRRVLGLTTLLEVERLTALQAGDCSVLLLFQQGATAESADTPGGVIPGHPGVGPTHFAFSIASADVPQWKQRLEAEGVAIESTVDWPGGAESIYFRDPDENLVELLTPGFWRFG